MPTWDRTESLMFETRVLDAAIRRKAERLEAERRVILDRLLAALRAQAPRLGLREAFIVGSLVQQGAWTEDSDVDVAISGGDPLRVMRTLEEAVDRDVDVIDLDRHPEPGLFRRRGTKVIG